MINNCKALISVIIPVYNVEKYLDECISSVVKQTYSNLEIIIVDDGSTDKSPIICDEWMKKDSRIKVVHKKNEGLSSARNIGIDNFSGEYICFFDSDDYIDTHTIEYLHKALCENDADVSICRERAFFDNDKNISIDNSNINIESVENREQVLLHFTDNFTGPVCWACNKLYSRKSIQNHRFIVGKKVEDLPFNLEVLSQVDKVVWLSNRMYYYRQQNNSIMHTKRNDVLKAWTDSLVYQCRYLENRCSKENFSIQVAFCLRAIFRREIEAHTEKLDDAEQYIYRCYCSIHQKYSKNISGIRNKAYLLAIKKANKFLISIKSR